MSASTLSYHLDKLLDERLIEKRTLVQVGNARVNEIAVNPRAIQRVRRLIDLDVSRRTLVTGFGALDTGYKLPDTIAGLLASQYHEIDRIVCFTSDDALAIRKAKEQQEQLVHVDRYCVYPYEAYRDLDSPFFAAVESILQEETKAADLILDVTPLSKLYSFKFFELSDTFGFPCCYVGKKNGQDALTWLTGLEFFTKENHHRGN